MYLLYVDESGVHAGQHPFVLGALAVHERDIFPLQKQLDEVVLRVTGTAASDPSELELHGSELRNAPARSHWSAIGRDVRLRVLAAAYGALGDFSPTDGNKPVTAFGVVVERSFRPGWSPEERECWAYEVMMHKFDQMLRRSHPGERGLIVHDRRLSEHQIQGWARRWKAEGGTLGRLIRSAEVPLFADSRASRLLQAADLVSYALFRAHGNPLSREAGLDRIHHLFDAADSRLHGLVHFTPDFPAGQCRCDACEMRHRAAAARAFVRRRIPRSQVAVMPLS